MGGRVNRVVCRAILSYYGQVVASGQFGSQVTVGSVDRTKLSFKSRMRDLWLSPDAVWDVKPKTNLWNWVFSVELRLMVCSIWGGRSVGK